MRVLKLFEALKNALTNKQKTLYSENFKNKRFFFQVNSIKKSL